MAGIGNINFSEIPEQNAAIPAGIYPAYIVESGGNPDDERTDANGLVASKSGKGKYLPMTFEIADGDYKGRKIKKSFNLEHVNPQVVSIAQSELKSLLVALGWNFTQKPCGPADTSEIHLIPLSIQIRQTRDQDNEVQSEIYKFLPKNSGSGYAAGNASAPAPATPAIPPWSRQ